MSRKKLILTDLPDKVIKNLNGFRTNFKQKTMNLFSLFKRELYRPWKNILFMAFLSGLSNSVILFITIYYIGNPERQGKPAKYFILFIIATLIFVISKKYALTKAAAFTENLIKNIRVRVVNKIRNSELGFIENIEDSYIYTRITQDTNFISQSAIVIVTSCQNLLSVIFCLMFLAWLSLFSFLFTVGAIGAATVVFMSYKKRIRILMDESTNEEARLFGYLTHILNGFKEIKLNRRKSDDLFKQFENSANSTECLKVKTGNHFSNDIIYSQAFVMALVAVVAFVLPSITSVSSQVTVMTVMVIIFLIGPIELLMTNIPIFSRANLAIDNIYKLEELLDKEGGNGCEYNGEYNGGEFKDINVDKMSFSYNDADGKAIFKLGPINLNIKKGEHVFIVGGNGSGKSTLLKLLTGLYYPEHGNIILDSELVSKPDYQRYRELFSIIFTDFHLFDRLYGLVNIDKKMLNDLLKLMELNKKTQYKKGRFTNTNLSTGQRKRLAMIVSFLDDKPIYVFDEVAADQDPQFRKYFYEELLKDLKAKGKTVIAATHDDKYFHVADRVLKMDYGQMQNL